MTDQFVFQEKNFEKTNANLFLCFNMFALILHDFGLVVDHSKSKVFHFTWTTKNANPLHSIFSYLVDQPSNTTLISMPTEPCPQ